MSEFASLLEAIDGLKAEGYTEDFNLGTDCISCRNGMLKIFHDGFEIDKYYRFDNDSDPEDQSIVYAISSQNHNLMGTLVNSYGIYAEPLTDAMLEKLSIAHM